MNSTAPSTSFIQEFKLALRQPYFLIAFVYFFCLLFGYYLLRPVREETGILAGVDNIQWLWTGTFVTMIFIVPLFGYLKNNLSRKTLVVGVHLFFFTNLLLFYMLFDANHISVWTARAFFVWLSVFNMFAVSVFWSLMADVLKPGQVKQLFAPISAGGSMGGIAGSWVTSTFVEQIGIRNLLLLAAILLVAVAFCAWRIVTMRVGASDSVTVVASKAANEERDVGSVLAGVTAIFGSRYLTQLTVLAFIYTLIASWLYFIQAHLVNDFISDSLARTQFFANINLAINSIALVLQFFVTSLMVRKLGIGSTYAIMLVLILISVVVLGLWPAVATIAGAQIAFRSGQFGTMKPCYDMFFSAVSQEQKYKSKNFIDTSIVRAGDLSGAFSFTAMKAIGMSIAGVTWVVAVGLVAFCAIALDAGRRFDRKIARIESPGRE